jgi:hypothetical protein
MSILSTAEKSSVRRLIHDTINRLREGDSRQCDIGARYAHILEVLWSRVDTGFTKPGGGIQNSHLQNNSNHWHNQQPRQPTRNQDDQQQHSNHDGFSWLDLEAIGDFVWTENTMRGYEDATTELANLPSSIEAQLGEDVGWSSGTRLQTVNETSSLLF